MKKVFVAFTLVLAGYIALAQDTLVVQTLTFDSITTRRGTWQFPEGETFRKILMLHTLKCDPQTTHDQYDCGEWDYLTYNIVHRHTGIYDSTLYFHPSFTLIEGTSPDSIQLSDTPTFQYFYNLHSSVYFQDTVSMSQVETGTPDTTDHRALPTNFISGRSQFLWKAEELAENGLTAGPVTGIKLHCASSGSFARHMMVRMAGTNLQELGPDTIVNQLDTVFYDALTLNQEWTDLNFFVPFEWDGSSNILIDLSFSNSEPGSETSLYMEKAGFPCGSVSGSDNFAIALDGISDFIKIPEGTYFNSDFTFETWFLKRSNNNWSRIFDFGNGPGQENVIVVLSRETTGKLSFHITKDGYSRSFELSDATPLNEWTHLSLRLTGNIGWAYINGSLAKYGLLQTPPDEPRNVNFIGRSNWSNDRLANVLLDEFRLYNTALSPAQIKSHYRQEIADPLNEANLVFYYKFDEGQGILANDAASGNHHAQCFGYPEWYPVQGPEIFLGFRQYEMRPHLILEQLVSSDVQVNQTVILDPVPHSPLQVILFEDPAHPTVPTDTITAWEAGYQPVYRNWQVIDSVWEAPDVTMIRQMLPYYGEPFEIIEDFEIGRYITPYGINLSLGPGFTWVYDVTDYAPLLSGMVDLSAGNQQELIDLKFLFIKGTPPREVRQVDRIWGGLQSFYYKDLDDDVQMSAKTLSLRPDASQWRVKTRLTGHGHNSNTGEYPHCCEWKDNEHYLLVNGQQAAAWHIFQYHDCALNPVYPQGGTWPGAREGWCPGDLVDDHDWEITDLIDGEQVTLDYDLTPVPPDNPGMGWGNYVTNMDLIHYGPNHFDNDAEIYDVISPNNDQYYSRINPICYGPAIILKNNGTSPLQSVKIDYGISGAQQESWTWSGNLEPHCSDTVILPVPGYAFWIGDQDHRFTAKVSEPNGTQDQYADNDIYTTRFNMPDLINTPIVTVLKTNKQAYRYRMEVRDIAGNILLTRENLENNTVYKDTLDFPFGCYSIELTDAEDMGLSYWAYPEQGTGYLRLMDLDSNIIRNFNAEFGRTIFYTYNVSEGYYIGEPGYENIVNVYPNPTTGRVNIDLADIQGKIDVRIINMQGMIILETKNEAGHFECDLSGHPSGLYFVEVRHKGFSFSKKIILQ